MIFCLVEVLCETDSMEQIPGEANSHSASQGIRYHKRLPLNLTLSQMNPVLISHPISSHLCIGTLCGTLPIRFFEQNFICIFHLYFVCYVPHLSHRPWFNHPNTWWRVQIMKLFSVWYSPSSCHFLSLQLLFSETLNLYSSPDVRHQVTHPYKTKKKMFLVERFLKNSEASHFFSVFMSLCINSFCN